MIKVAIQSSGGLSKDDIENMVKESEKYAEKDKKRRELIEEINKAEAILHDTETKMDEFKDQLPKEEYEKLKTGITEIKDKLNGLDRENDTIDAIKPMVDNFQKDSLKLFELAYKKVSFFKTQPFFCCFIKMFWFCRCSLIVSHLDLRRRRRRPLRNQRAPIRRKKAKRKINNILCIMKFTFCLPNI